MFPVGLLVSQTCTRIYYEIIIKNQLMVTEDDSLGYIVQYFENKRENKRFMLICFPASLLLSKSLLIYSYVFSVVE
jgi:hypothetical protein